MMQDVLLEPFLYINVSDRKILRTSSINNHTNGFASLKDGDKVSKITKKGKSSAEIYRTAQTIKLTAETGQDAHSLG